MSSYYKCVRRARVLSGILVVFIVLMIVLVRHIQQKQRVAGSAGRGRFGQNDPVAVGTAAAADDSNSTSTGACRRSSATCASH
jgi:hypothetical protein